MRPKSPGYIDFTAVKNAVSLEQILKHYEILDQLEPSGPSGLRGCCPIHQGNDPKEFSVTLAKNLWHCFSRCDLGGNHLEFVAEMEQCTMNEAAWKLNEWFSLGFEKLPRKNSSKREGQRSQKKADSNHSGKRTPSKTEAKPKTPPEKIEETGENKPLGFSLSNLDPTHPYLVERGLNPETIAEFGVAFCPKGSMGGRIVIPIHNPTGELVAYAGRWPGEPPKGMEKYLFPSKFKKSLELFNVHRAMEEPRDQLLLITTGFFEAMILWQNGYRKVVALMEGALSCRQEGLIEQMVNSQTLVLLGLDESVTKNEATAKAVQHLADRCFIRVSRIGSDLWKSII